MKQNQNVITWNSAYYNKYGIELSQDLNTIRITARCLPSEFNLTDEEKEDMTLEEVEQEQKSRWERSWKWFIPWLSDTLQGAVLFEWDKTMKDRLVSRAPKEIIVDENHPYLSARDGVLFNKEQTELLWYPYGREEETYTIPNGVTKISYQAFAGHMVTVAMRNQGGSKAEHLVCNRNLRHVIMPDTVTVIGEKAFSHCIFLNSVKLSNTLAEIGSEAFKGCKKMREISLPDSLERLIAEQQYHYRRYRTNFFPDNLERVNFLGTRCRLQPIITHRTWKLNAPEITEPYTPKFFSQIFRSQKNVTITFEAGNERFSSEEGVIFNKDRTELLYCPQWKSGIYTVPKTVVRIGERAFAGGCRGLTRVIFAGSAVTDIGDEAFSFCKALQDIDLRSIKHIGYRAFVGCEALTHIDLRSVEHIGELAFSDCTALGAHNHDPQKLQVYEFL